MKKLFVLFLFTVMFSFSLIAGTVDMNSRGIMLVGEDGKIYWSEKGGDFKPFAVLPENVKAVAIGITDKTAFALGADGAVYVYKGSDKKFVLFGKLPNNIKGLDITAFEDADTKRLFVVGSDDFMYMPEGQGKFKKFKELPGNNPGDDDDNNNNNDDDDNFNF